MSNFAKNMIDEFYNSIAEKDWPSWAAEAVAELEKFLATQPQAPQGAVTPKVSIFQYARCNNTLRLMARPYPRTCAECGLGPSKTGSVAAPETPEGDKP